MSDDAKISQKEKSADGEYLNLQLNCLRSEKERLVSQLETISKLNNDLESKKSNEVEALKNEITTLKTENKNLRTDVVKLTKLCDNHSHDLKTRRSDVMKLESALFHARAQLEEYELESVDSKNMTEEIEFLRRRVAILNDCQAQYASKFNDISAFVEVNSKLQLQKAYNGEIESLKKNELIHQRELNLLNKKVECLQKEVNLKYDQIDQQKHELGQRKKEYDESLSAVMKSNDVLQVLNSTLHMQLLEMRANFSTVSKKNVSQAVSPSSSSSKSQQNRQRAATFSAKSVSPSTKPVSPRTVDRRFRRSLSERLGETSDSASKSMIDSRRMRLLSPEHALYGRPNDILEEEHEEMENVAKSQQQNVMSSGTEEASSYDPLNDEEGDDYMEGVGSSPFYVGSPPSNESSLNDKRFNTQQNSGIRGEGVGHRRLVAMDKSARALQTMRDHYLSRRKREQEEKEQKRGIGGRGILRSEDDSATTTLHSSSLKERTRFHSLSQTTTSQIEEKRESFLESLQSDGKLTT